jgi:hypothetical protein
MTSDRKIQSNRKNAQKAPARDLKLAGVEAVATRYAMAWRLR